ncbi:hypothetical protein A4X06_0g7586 [Tilletia controversa]|uniref:Acyl-CoA oxidase n=1 Tax=Tilletia controversa TaxID=13291 RepID=A0A8X7STU4_9BASI|nr:hypothetical protein A4X06_0g7586 [Tilletia controversa]
MLSLDLQSPITIHWIAFVPVIMSQGTPDQIDRWGSRAMRHEIMGAYLQTELGHGSNVAGLETTATFDKASAIIHSSTLTSTKWWAGGLGTTATHAVVQAQLILDGKGIGPHLFFVPLRSVETGQLFEGVHAGDIGPKAYGAFGGLDNGWARSDHYRIPRENMFMKHSQVTKEGQYVKPPSSKMSYLGMTFIRSQMIDRCGWMLSRGITIAIRYSSVRRQFRGPDSTTKSDEERAVISSLFSSSRKPRSLTSGWRLYDIRLAPDVASDVVYNPKRLFGVITLDVNRASTFLSGIANFKPAKVNVPIVSGHSGVTIVPLFYQVAHGFFVSAGELRAVREVQTLHPVWW